MIKRQFKISVSVSDFPLFIRTDKIFKKVKQAGADNIEYVFGIKSFFHFRSISDLSKRYDLPITAIHQPIWSGLGLFFDTNFLKLAKETNVKNLVVHPLPRLSFKHPKARAYFKKLAQIQKEYGVCVFLENMPKHYSIGLINNFFFSDLDSCNLLKIDEVAREFNFKINFDISHFAVNNPQKLPWFKKILPRIGNIHLSSFTKSTQHLPLNMGNFDAKSFLSYLLRNNYQKLLTLEVFYPKLITFTNTDFGAIKDSVKIIKEIR